MRWILYLFLSTTLFAAQVHAGDEDAAKSKANLTYVDLSPSLVTNLDGRHYLRCEVQLMTHDEEQADNLKLHAPMLRHTLLLLLSDQKAAELKSPKTREKVRKEALAALQQALKEEIGKKAVDDLFFTTFLVQ